MFSKQLNVFHCVCHFVGTLFTGWFLVQVWGYKSYWYVACIYLLETLLTYLSSFAPIPTGPSWFYLTSFQQ